MLKDKFTTIFTGISLLIVATLLSVSMIAHTMPPYVADEVITETKEVMAKDVDCLAKNIYYEAASESFEGKLAVAQVTINRTKSNRYPNNICGVVYQKDKINGKTVCQFSWTCEKVSAPRNQYLWEEALYIARKALTEPIAHAKIAAHNVMYYHAAYVNPGWKKNGIVMRIGNHIFYTRT
ncbi:MAG: cell wall hydrolase [Proteobacteria bacterium]|nr:cell wall hydrolase [Pseudomonadota bacterium]